MARYAVLSDIHSNLEALNAVLAKCQELGITDFISLGDVVGYNANPAECCAIVRQLNIVSRVRGNHDDYSVRGNIEQSGFNANAQKAIRWTREHLSDDDRKWLDEAEYESKFPLGCSKTIVDLINILKKWAIAHFLFFAFVLISNCIITCIFVPIDIFTYCLPLVFSTTIFYTCK